MKRSFVLLAVLAGAFASPLSADTTKLEIIPDENAAGLLWSSSFQRIDGSTCAWIEFEAGQPTRLIYDNSVGLCRNDPPEAPQGVYEFSGVKGDRLQFSGADFDIEKNTGSMVSGSWNHVSYNSAFKADNVVFRRLK